MSNQDYYIKIHGHSCLEIRSKNVAIIFDPWLCGSAYWRSWWNFPEPSSVETLIKDFSDCKDVFVYITHLHWDHFHGPTLRRLCKGIPNLKFLISRVPEKRLKNDLFEVLNNKVQIFEINHGEKFEINSELSLQPFLSGPILTDSAVLIQYKNDFILNLNDSKQQSLMAKHIASSISDGNLKVMLRSHASANSRICIRNRDGSKKENNDKSKEVYSREFLSAASLYKPKLAIPFASNMCYLHKDSYKYNSHSNTSDLLYNFHLSSKEFQKINVQLVLPGEVLDLKTLQTTINQDSRNQLFSDRNSELKIYREKFHKKLQISENIQETCNFSEKVIRKYFNFIFSNLPFFIRFFANGRIAFYEKNYKAHKKYFVVDTFKKKIFFNKSEIEKCHTIIYVKPGVLNSALAQRNLNSLGISKLLDIHTSSTKSYNLFFILCIYAEIESSPFISIKQLLRSIEIWSRRWRELLDYIFIVIRIKKII